MKQCSHFSVVALTLKCGQKLETSSCETPWKTLVIKEDLDALLFFSTGKDGGSCSGKMYLHCSYGESSILSNCSKVPKNYLIMMISSLKTLKFMSL